MWAIDADEAIIGHIDDYQARLADSPSVHNQARGLPVAVLAPAARAAARLPRTLSTAEVHQRLEAACALAREPRVADLAGAVSTRAGALPDIVEHYLQDLQALR